MSISLAIRSGGHHLKTQACKLQRPACRKLSTAQQSPKVMVLTGATAQMAQPIIAEALERNYEVVACARNPEAVKANLPLHPRIKVVTTPKPNVAAWSELLQEHVKDGSRVKLVNTIGAAVPPKGQTLREVNELPVLSAAEALAKQSKRFSRCAIGHFSTIAASYLPECPKAQASMHPKALEYCQGRVSVDKALGQFGLPATIVRPGFIFTDLRGGRVIDTRHPYSPEQFATLPLHPVLGSGKQPQQPVYDGDVILALLNGIEQDEFQIIDAVGPETLSQSEMFEFFVQLKGGKFCPIKVPFDLAGVIAAHFPKGRVAPYSIDMFRIMDEHNKGALCKRKFESLVGRPLKKMSEVYGQSKDEPFVFAKPPIQCHAKEILEGMLKDKEARSDILRMVKKYGLPMCAQVIKALLGS